MEEAISTVTNIEREDIRITNIRPAWGNCQIARLRVGKGLEG